VFSTEGSVWDRVHYPLMDQTRQIFSRDFLGVVDRAGFQAKATLLKNIARSVEHDLWPQHRGVYRV
jgi:hypothetical protein